MKGAWLLGSSQGERKSVMGNFEINGKLFPWKTLMPSFTQKQRAKEFYFQEEI